MNTPGPWKINDYIDDGKNGYIHISGPNGERIADIFPFAGVGGVGPETARQNARLMVKTVNEAAQILAPRPPEGKGDA